jgi:hypothetical protein
MASEPVVIDLTRDDDDVVDPYALLGVTIASTCQEVRRAYYQLALVAHPDKGGCRAQMRVVQAAYEYVSRQVAGVNRSRTYEDLETAFADFLKAQTLAPPCFMDIHADVFDLPRFNDLWDAATARRNTDPASTPGGYGGSMAASMVASDVYSPVDTGDVPGLPLELVLFEAPLPRTRPDVLARDLTAPVGPLDDYSTDDMCDYRAAFAGLLPDGIQVPDETPVRELFEAARRQRE